MPGTYLVMTFIEGLIEIGRLSSEMTGNRSCLYFVSFAHFVVKLSGIIHHETPETGDAPPNAYRQYFSIFLIT